MFLLIDIGGTSTRLGVSRDGVSVYKHSIFPTLPSFDDFCKEFQEEFIRLTGSEKINYSCCGVRQLNTTKDALSHDFKLPDWEDKPLKKFLEETTHSLVYMENDTSLAGLGEAVFGAGSRYEVVAYLTISTGLNGVRVYKGKLLDKPIGQEIGHTVIDMDFSFIPQAKNLESQGFGQVETYVSGGALAQLYGKEPAQIQDKALWEKYNEALAIYIINTALYWSPDIVIIGGGLGDSDKVSLDLLVSQISTLWTSRLPLPKVVKAQLGDQNGLYGALAYIKYTIVS